MVCSKTNKPTVLFLPVDRSVYSMYRLFGSILTRKRSVLLSPSRIWNKLIFLTRCFILDPLNNHATRDIEPIAQKTWNRHQASQRTDLHAKWGYRGSRFLKHIMELNFPISATCAVMDCDLLGGFHERRAGSLIFLNKSRPIHEKKNILKFSSTGLLHSYACAALCFLLYITSTSRQA